MRPSRIVRRFFISCAAIGILCGIVWITTDLPGQFDPVRCAPHGLLAELNARVRGDAFWQARLPFLKAERDRIATSLDRPRSSATAQANPALEQAQQLMQRIYTQHPELAPRPAAKAAAQFREAAIEIERRDLEDQFLEHLARELGARDRCIQAIGG